MYPFFGHINYLIIYVEESALSRTKKNDPKKAVLFSLFFIFRGQ